MKYTLKGKTGQERKDGKKTGGKMFCLEVPKAEAEKIFAKVLELNPGKLAQFMFAYGLTAEAQEAVGYEIPGAVEWKEGGEVKAVEWTEKDTEDYCDALVAYVNMPREGGFSLEGRQKTWDTKAETLRANGLPDAVIVQVLGKRPQGK